MLSRTADHLFWMSRYMERAENTARMLDVNYQTALLPQSAQTSEQGWSGLLSISELTGPFSQKHGEVNARSVMEFMVRDETNLSSIVACLRAARENARAVRGALTTEVWETQNQTWLEFNRMLKEDAFERDPGRLRGHELSVHALSEAMSWSGQVVLFVDAQRGWEGSQKRVLFLSLIHI